MIDGFQQSVLRALSAVGTHIFATSVFRAQHKAGGPSRKMLLRGCDALYMKEVSIRVVSSCDLNVLARVLANLLCVLHRIDLFCSRIVQCETTSILHAFQRAIFVVGSAFGFHHVVMRVHLSAHFVHDLSCERPLIRFTEDDERSNQK
jgi:hypothetical protein